MRYELFIGLRYLFARRRETFISLITLISVLGVMIGVMTLNVVMAVMTGFEEVLRDRLLGINAHVAVLKPGDMLTDYERLTETILQEEGVAAAPSIFGQVMLSSGNRVSGVVVRGIDPDRMTRVIDIQRYMKEGGLETLKRSRTAELDGQTVQLPGLVLGSRLAGQLGVMIGDPIQVISPLGTPGPLGMIPKIRRYMVTGLFDSGMHEYDSSLVYMGLSDAQQFFDLKDAVTSIEVRVRNVYQAQEVAKRIQGKLGLSYWAEDWTRLWPNLFSALRLEKTVYFLVLLLMVLIGAFNIVSTLIMVVMEKRKDIAILQSMGATRRGIWRIFMIKGALIGFVGTLFGVIFGYLVCLLIQRYQFIELPKDVFLISTVPVRIYLINFAAVGAASFLICLLASIYPARKAARLDPVEIIRYE
jgi:lipoprotein-releasing system permease protein